MKHLYLILATSLLAVFGTYEKFYINSYYFIQSYFFFQFQEKMLEILDVTNVVPQTGGVMISMKLLAMKMMP